ncbi:MAG: NTP transferase domain-containing protein [Armatimonadetes bacterium]|nr:NTP transferase domain-containing protein [Armatimonadota bacterium]
MTRELTQFSGLVLAAGRGSRFQSETGEAFPKVLRPVLGKPMVSYVIEALTRAGIEDIVLVVGFGADEVRQSVGPGVGYVFQSEQKGSGHAVACAREMFEHYAEHLVIMCGDSPLFSAETVSRMMREHTEAGAAVTLASAVLDDPFGYGRIVRDASGRIRGIVEEKCAEPDQREIKEVNGGAYVFDSPWLYGNIERMVVNDAGEYNLTDMVRVAVEQDRVVSAVECDPVELMGVNTPELLKIVEDIIRGKEHPERQA